MQAVTIFPIGSQLQLKRDERIIFLSICTISSRSNETFQLSIPVLTNIPGIIYVYKNIFNRFTACLITTDKASIRRQGRAGAGKGSRTALMQVGPGRALPRTRAQP